MNDQRDEHYKPWQRDADKAAPGPAPSPPRPAEPAASGVARPSTPPPPPGTTRPTRSLSADELLARPAPLPSLPADDGPSAGEKLREGLHRLGSAVRAANERLEPGRRARVAGAAAQRGSRRAAAAIARTTAKAVNSLRERAAPRVREAAGAVQQGVVKGAAAAKAGLEEGTAQARQGLSRSAEQARARLGAGAATAADKLREAIPARPAPPAPPPSELDRLLAREGGAEDMAAAAAPSPPALPLFTGNPAAAAAPPRSAAPPPSAASATAIPSVAAVPPAAPFAESLQSEAEAAADADERPLRPRRERMGRTGGGEWGAGSLGQWARHPATWVLGALALLLAGFGLGRWSAGTSEAAIGAAAEAHILAHPDIIPRAMQRLQENRAAAAITQVRSQLTTPFSGAWAGNANGDTTLVVFTDYACTFCRASVPDIDRLLREDRDLKIVFRELPILSADSEAAARVALVAARRGSYMPVHRALFAGQVPDAAARSAAASAAGLDIGAAQTGDPAISRELDNNVALARQLGIDGTPAFVIGDRLLVGAVGYEALRRAIAAARE